MNKRQVIILWVIALVLAGAVAVTKLRQKETDSSATSRAVGSTLFEKFPAAEASTIEFQGIANNAVTLTKKDGKWVVVQRDNYPANNTYANEFLRTLSELKVTQGMKAGPSFAPRFGMDETSNVAADRGLTATFKDATGKEIAKVSLGKNIESGADPSPMGGGNSVGRYIRNHNDDSGFYGVKETFPSVSAEAPRWLDDSFISLEKIKSITLSQPDKQDAAWNLTRDSEEAEFKLVNAAATEVLDTAATSPLKSLFSYSRFEDVVPADKIAERAASEGKRTISIITFEGFNYTIQLTPTKPTSAPPAALSANSTPPGATDNFLMTVTVNAEIPKERKKEEGEKPEDAKTKDAAFAERQKTLTDKLAKESAFAGRTFEVSKSTVDPVLKERSALITTATPPPAAGSGNVQKLPGGLIATPSGHASATTEPIQAFTPPISVSGAEEAVPAEAPQEDKKK